MRPSSWFCLLAAVLAGAVHVSLAQARPHWAWLSRAEGRAPAAIRPAPQVPNPTWIEDGYGASEADARDVALKKAEDSVEEHLKRLYGSKGWKVSADYLRQMQVVRFEKPEEVELTPGQRVVKVRAVVELTPSYLEAMQGVVRQQRVEQRHLVLARVLAGLVVLLLVGAGYLRLEEATRGYYTTVLRVAALGLVAVIGLGLLVIG